jgi:uncharacterized membrane protein
MGVSFPHPHQKFGHAFCITFEPQLQSMNDRFRLRRAITARKIFRYFIQGIIILAPIGITAYVLYWLFDNVDSILRPYVNIPGLGFAIILAFVILVGWVSSNFLMGSAISFFDQWMERTPVVKFIYSSTKDFFEAFAGDKKKFNRAVLANIFSEDVWIVGFLTDEEMQKFDLGADQVAVYVPQAYNFAGQLYILPREKVRKIERITSGEAMKYAVTGGVVDLDAERDQQKKSELRTERE